jgi:hypothetical protein
MDTDRTYQEHQNQLKESWFWYRYDLTVSEGDRAEQALRKMIDAQQWAEEQFGEERVVRIGDLFYFEREEDCLQFKLTWV